MSLKNQAVSVLTHATLYLEKKTEIGAKIDNHQSLCFSMS